MARRRAKARRPRRMRLTIPRLAIPPQAFMATALVALGLCLLGLVSVEAAGDTIAACMILAPLSAVVCLAYRALKRKRRVVIIWH